MRPLTPNPENGALPPKCSLGSPGSAVSRAPHHLDIQDKIAWLTFDLPGEKVNKLSAAVMMSLLEKTR